MFCMSRTPERRVAISKSPFTCGFTVSLGGRQGEERGRKEY